MARLHLKRLAAPLTWPVGRKGGKFIARPKGSFALEMGLPLITALKDVLKLVKTRKEGKLVLNTKEVLVNGKRRKDEKFMIGLMDALTIKDLGQSYRVLLNRRGLLRLVPLGESSVSIKLCRITGKRAVRGGKVQLSLHDGRSCLGANAHAVGDTLVLELPSNKVVQHIKLEDRCNVYITGGSHVGCFGVVEHVLGNKAVVRLGDGEAIETAKRFVFVVGKDKPVVSGFGLG